MKYKDQNGFELYDHYDQEANEAVPEMILNAPVIRESNDGRSSTVRIDYPVVSGFTLASTYDGANVTELGRKAFVRGGKYKHPYKGTEVVIEEMSPTKYLIRAHMLLQSVGSKLNFEEMIEFKLEGYDLNEKISPYEGKMFYPYINYANRNQEGIHRALWAEEKRFSTIPVIIIR